MKAAVGTHIPRPLFLYVRNGACRLFRPQSVRTIMNHMLLWIKRIIFWGIFLLLIYYIGKPYRESGTDIGIGFVISLAGLGTILYFVAKWLFLDREVKEKRESGDHLE